MMEDKSILRSVELFNELTDEELGKVAKHLSALDLAKGSVLFKIRDFGDELYIITEGKIRISREVGDVELVFTTLGKGTFFGEIAVIDELYRSASATAEDDCALLVLSRKTLEDLAAHEPLIAYKLLYTIAKVLSRRIRRSNEAMETYIRINQALVDNPGFTDLYKGVIS
jgi:CRP/FNR family cyclic AMP-dependent transcriptional regulator